MQTRQMGVIHATCIDADRRRLKVAGVIVDELGHGVGQPLQTVRADSAFDGAPSKPTSS